MYTATKHGWFETFSFTDWFQKVLLPHVRRLLGRKVMIGDNLSSHLSFDVINQCRENDMEFVCLPANGTDKMQQLDVGVFGPMKHAWREQIRHYRKIDPSIRLVDKKIFPKMLTELLQTLKAEELLGLFRRQASSPSMPPKSLRGSPVS